MKTITASLENVRMIEMVMLAEVERLSAEIDGDAGTITLMVR